MARAEASVEELVGMIERGELPLPEMQRRYVWRAPRVRDLLDSLYRGYPSGASSRCAPEPPSSQDYRRRRHRHLRRARHQAKSSCNQYRGSLGPAPWN